MFGQKHFLPRLVNYIGYNRRAKVQKNFVPQKYFLLITKFNLYRITLAGCRRIPFLIFSDFFFNCIENSTSVTTADAHPTAEMGNQNRPLVIRCKNGCSYRNTMPNN